MAILNPEDALGIASRDRAERRRWASFAEHGNIRALDANAMAPSWDAFLERLHESGAKVKAGPSFNEPYTPTFNPMRRQQSAVVNTTPQVNKQGGVTGYEVSGGGSSFASPGSIRGLMKVRR